MRKWEASGSPAMVEMSSTEMVTTSDGFSSPFKAFSPRFWN
jgi:hypothetical protein